MNLDLVKNLINSAKENDAVQKFVKELGEFLENNIENGTRNELSLLQKIQSENKLTVSYRDKMHVERSNILEDYAKETSDEGTMCFIYSKSSGKDNTYNSCICGEGNSHKVIEIKESELPKCAGVDSVLRLRNGKYVLDEVATVDVQEKMTEMVSRLLEEQDIELQEKRVEGHVYEFVEKSGDTVWLIDTTKNDGECFEEVDFPSDIFNNATEGDLFQYVDGEYRI